ncbi:sialate O-acetylesterase [Sphingobacterium psychroaquaticum]|uniref:sialate O-acetylesterase n=1 Tax=Sphingobacterium psychroaquaticum TaxID=561061 RepID=UPI001F114827|nr:sialate O-acetylesterase [Sphingobacterium psychroaquaticum]
MKNLKLLFVTLVFLLYGNLIYAQLRLPNFFSDHMVLQRESAVNLWGWGYAGSTVKVHGSWNKDTVTVKTDANGKWKLKINTVQAGGPYKLSVVSGGELIQFTDVLLGDVFLCSGQSNMEWGGNQNLKEILDELPHANNPNIRLLQVNRNGALAPQENISNGWSSLNEKALKPFSAIGYFLAKELNKKQGVPIGIVNSSWGGTAAEVWTPKDQVEADQALLAFSKMQKANDYRPHENGVLWNGMIAPLVGFNLKGFFWYQGESNVGSSAGYDKLMKTMVNSWRSAWEEELPFYFVQIAPYAYNSKGGVQSALLREQQAKTAVELPRSGMVVVTDLVDNVHDIHPIQKQGVASRLAKITLAEIYQIPTPDYKSPIYSAHVVKGDKVEVTFHYLTGNLVTRGKEITDLYIAGEDKVFHKASGKIQKDKLLVFSSKVARPVAVRFGFTDTAMPNLFNEKGLPVSPFRTDSWVD